MSDELEAMLARVRQHQGAGYLHSHAFELAAFEARVDRAWPATWGSDLVALVFGDFEPPATTLTYASLGISVEPEKQEGTVIRSAMTVLLARVTIPDKSVPSVKDAARRLNLLVGALSYVNQGAPIRWWCYVMSPTAGGLGYTLTDGEPATLLALIELLPTDVRRQVGTALFWLREPRSMLLEQQARTDQLAVYAGYWNAFECLVEAANLLVPPRKLTRTEKNAALNARLAESNGVLNVAIVAAMYREIIDRGLREKAAHAVRLCSEDDADGWIADAFAYRPPEHGLYAIRNAINHGTIDVNDPETVMLVDSRFSSLFRLVRVLLNGILNINAIERVRASMRSEQPG